jgi:hypothetical protein
MLFWFENRTGKLWIGLNRWDMGKKKEIGPYPPVEPISEIAKYLINQVSTNNYINSERKCIYLANFGLSNDLFQIF